MTFESKQEEYLVYSESGKVSVRTCPRKRVKFSTQDK